MTRIDNLNSWHSDWRGLRVVVLGLGVTGFSVADTLCELGAEVLVLAERAEPELEDVLDVIGVTHLTGAKVDLSNEASFPAELLAFEAQLVITSPGCSSPEAGLPSATEATTAPEPLMPMS